jgi:N-acetylated-alpha-linked acidic dipeptidase
MGQVQKSEASGEVKIADIGGGTDYVAFLDHLGIPSTDFTFEGPYGVYHSAFDDHRWMKSFGDPTFEYHVAAARFLGLQIMRLANSDLLPLDYELYGGEVSQYVDELRQALRRADDHAELKLPSLETAAKELARVGREVRARGERAVLSESSRDLSAVNRALVQAESRMLLEAGLPRRPWYRHSIFAPGIRDGYGATHLPGVREAVDEHNIEEANRQLELLVIRLKSAAALLEEAATRTTEFDRQHSFSELPVGDQKVVMGNHQRQSFADPHNCLPESVCTR